jgi:hypothetical protein
MRDSMRDTLVNTSLPAKEAPQLAPATLASLTSTSAASGSATTAVKSITSTLSSLRLEKKSVYQPLSKVQLTDDDFPTLGGKSAKASTVIQGTNYATLSRDWAKKQEEDAVAAKDAAEKERSRIQANQFIRQKEAKEAEEFRMRNIMLPVKRNKIDQQVLDIGGNESDGSVAESYDSPPEVDYEEEEEEEEEEMKSHWDGRRYRNEL